MAPTEKVCPLMSKGYESMSCFGEKCQWWFKEDSPQAKGDCVIQAIRTSLYLSATKPK
jgi:hypothetical protein